MEQLSTHFTRAEMEPEGPMPDECVPIYTEICVEILEPTGEQFNLPMDVTSAYRSLSVNTKDHGQPDSEHEATVDKGATDFEMPGMNGDMRPVFDWMRNNPKLTWHQLILEHTNHGTTIIHVSKNRLKPGVRSCKEGHTNNATPYIDVECVPFEPENS